MNPNLILEQQYDAVINLLKQYYDGLYRCDVSLLKKVFHPRAQYFTASDGELLHLDMDTYLPMVENRVSPEHNGEPYGFSIDSIEFAGAVTAIAQVRSSMFSKNYIDLLSLICLDGQWTIISKVFHYTLSDKDQDQQKSSSEKS